VTSLREVGEAGIIRSLLPYLASKHDRLLIGPGEDDTAAWREPDGSVTVATCDTMVEGVHFERAWLDPEDVGWRALALAAGDLAAKGARPTYGLVSLALPESWSHEDVVRLYGGMAELAAQVGLQLVGGDLTAVSSAAAITLALLGKATSPDVLPRSAARPGWTVAVTGALGAPSAALRELSHGETCPPDWERALRRPVPQLERGQRLAAAHICCGDISDGLYQELEKFRTAAGVGARIELAKVPHVSGVSPEQALVSGEEVELVCVAPGELIAAAGELTAVGQLTGDAAIVVVGDGGEPVELSARGYEHFT
jgi:thiamine-monophosphate kinase